MCMVIKEYLNHDEPVLWRAAFFIEGIINHFNPCIYHIGAKMEMDKRLIFLSRGDVANRWLLW